MTRRRSITHEFVEFVPEVLVEGVLYISIQYRTAVHLCMCGCGTEVATPISRVDWQLAYDGESVSLHPSIGNWGLPCRSHYWISEARIVWADEWTSKEISAGRALDQEAIEEQFARVPLRAEGLAPKPPGGPSDERLSLWRRITRLWS